METLDMYIFLKSSAKGLSRGTHFSYAISPQLGATGAGKSCLPESDQNPCKKCEDLVIYDVSEARLKVFRTPQTVFDHIF